MSDINERIKTYCERRGIVFKPWESPRPWEIQDGEECPYPPNTMGAAWWPVLLHIRTKIKGEIDN